MRNSAGAIKEKIMSLFDTQKRKNATINNINKDYFKAVKTDDAFDHNYIEYESKGDENKHYQLKNILKKLGRAQNISQLISELLVYGKLI